MHSARDWHEIAITAEHERGLVGSGELGRVERVLDGLGALRREPDEASDEAAQRWSFIGQHGSLPTRSDPRQLPATDPPR